MPGKCDDLVVSLRDRRNHYDIDDSFICLRRNGIAGVPVRVSLGCIDT